MKKLLAAVACCGLMTMGAAQDETISKGPKASGTATAMPDFVLSAWYNSRGYDLEDYRGQLNFLVFYADNGG